MISDRHLRGERMRKRWARDRVKLLAVVLRNAAKGTAALTGTHYSPERSRRASDGQRGKRMGGLMAAGAGHLFAAQFSLCDPDGMVHRGHNIIDFVRTHSELFAPEDCQWQRGHCRASKGLSRLRPTVKRRLESWKGWTWA